MVGKIFDNLNGSGFNSRARPFALLVSLFVHSFAIVVLSVVFYNISLELSKEKKVERISVPVRIEFVNPFRSSPPALNKNPQKAKEINKPKFLTDTIAQSKDNDKKSDEPVIGSDSENTKVVGGEINPRVGEEKPIETREEAGNSGSKEIYGYEVEAEDNITITQAGPSVRIDENDSALRIIKYVHPTYPPDALKSKLEGTVIVEVFVGMNGRIKSVRIVRSSSPLFESSALNAVRQWVYSPIIINGEISEVVFNLTINYILR